MQETHVLLYVGSKAKGTAGTIPHFSYVDIAEYHSTTTGPSQKQEPESLWKVRRVGKGIYERYCSYYRDVWV